MLVFRHSREIFSGDSDRAFDIRRRHIQMSDPSLFSIRGRNQDAAGFKVDTETVGYRRREFSPDNVGLWQLDFKVAAASF